MNAKDSENSKELFARFLTGEDADAAADDIAAADKLINDNPAPQPDAAVLAEINAKINRTLALRQTSKVRMMRTAAVAAAAVIVAAVVVWQIPQRRTDRPKETVAAAMIPAAVWESDDLSADDVELADLTEQIDELENEIVALQTAQQDDEEAFDLSELETKIMSTKHYTWKG